jgi:type IV pilus assembly protein PilV
MMEVANKKTEKTLNMCRLRSNGGFTLIESMFSIAILAIGMFAVMSLLMSVIKGNILGKTVTTATTIAEDKMEDFKRMGYNNIADDSGTDTSYDIDYYWEATVENDIPAVNTKTITVDVYWSPGTTTSTHKVELNTIIVP